jgi:hypothetical protein
MNKDEIINRLRALVNHLPLMSFENQRYAIGKANEMLDKHFAKGGKFIPVSIVDWKPPNKKLQSDGLYQCPYNKTTKCLMTHQCCGCKTFAAHR